MDKGVDAKLIKAIFAEIVNHPNNEIIIEGYTKKEIVSYCIHLQEYGLIEGDFHAILNEEFVFGKSVTQKGMEFCMIFKKSDWEKAVEEYFTSAR